MARGGARPNAGCKSDADYTAIRSIMDKFIKDADWGAMLKAMKGEALKGNVRSFTALRDTRFGQPILAVQGVTGGAPILISEIVAEKPKEAKRCGS